MDGDFVLWESKAIAGYLVQAYGKDDGYYPKDAKLKAICDQRLYFDTGVLLARLRQICVRERDNVCNLSIDILF